MLLNQSIQKESNHVSNFLIYVNKKTKGFKNLWRCLWRRPFVQILSKTTPFKDDSVLGDIGLGFRDKELHEIGSSRDER